MVPGTVPVDTAVISPMTEAEAAERRRAEGFPTVCQHGRHWERMLGGFWQPIHILALLRAEEAVKPSPLCWGFRATLDDSATGMANGSLPVHMLSTIEDYTAERLGGNPRRQLNKCRRLVKIVRITSPVPLVTQGHAVVISSRVRTGYDYGGQSLSRKAYRAFAERLGGDSKYLVLAGLVDGKLGGYVVGTAVGDVAYVNSVDIATEYLPTAIGTGLLFEFVQVCRRSAGIRRVVHGLHAPEDAGLTSFKERMGFPVARFSSRVWFPAPVRRFIRWRAPYKYYRLTGEAPAVLARSADPLDPEARGQ